MGRLEIASLHDDSTALVNQSTPVFDARDMLERFPVLVEDARCPAVIAVVVDIIKGCVRNQDGDGCRAVQHGEPYATYRLPRRGRDR